MKCAHIFRPVCLTIFLLLAVTCVSAQKPPARKRTTATPAPPARQETRRKAIFEPVSYPGDLQLLDVFFVNPNVGWAVGGKNQAAGGFALYTNDGGDHWTINLGDPQSNAAAFSHMRFIDPRHGWMVQGNDQLLRTVDGQNWEVIAKIPDYYYDYVFTSPATGLMSSSGRIQRTVDGGKTWNPVFTCKISLQTNGLTQDVECTPQSLHFPTPQVGYFVAYYRSSTILGKSVDGGETWHVSLALPEEGGKEGEVFFQDENTGFLRIANGKVYATSDGGQTWHQLPGVYIGGRPEMKFADPEVGWSIVYRTMAFTTDGHRWTSRDIGFPANVNAFSLPTRNRGYVVGDHGMIYRYRIVPANYTAKGMIDAPLMPPYGGRVAEELQKMKAAAATLQAKLGGPKPGAQTAQALPHATQSSQAGLPTDASAAGGAQDTNPGASAGGGFVQDTSDVPLSPAMQTCCAAEIQNFQADFSSFAQQVPAFGGQFRNLNLLATGMNMLSDLMSRARGIREDFVALKKAPNTQAANATLQDLSLRLDSTTQTVTNGFAGEAAPQNPTGSFQQN